MTTCDHDWKDTSLHNAENGLPIVRCARCGLERDDGRTDADAIELAYGLLWLCPIDRATKFGELAYQARQALLPQLDRDGKLRGLKAAQDMLALGYPTPESRKNSRSEDSDAVTYWKRLW